MIAKNVQDLVQLLAKETGKKVVFASGSFDLFHYDHLRYIEDAKKQGEILVVLVKSNKAVRLKGTDRPVIDEEQRIAIVDAIRFVDYTMLVDYDENTEIHVEYDNESQYQWLKMFESVVDKVRPHIWMHEDSLVLHNARMRLFEKYGVQSIPRGRGKTTSTTQIVAKLTENP